MFGELLVQSSRGYMSIEKRSRWRPVEQRRRETITPREREVLRVRSELMNAIREYIESNRLTQKQAADRFAVSQPRISEIVQGKTELFTVDKLIELLNRVGKSVSISVVEQAGENGPDEPDC